MFNEKVLGNLVLANLIIAVAVLLMSLSTGAGLATAGLSTSADATEGAKPFTTIVTDISNTATAIIKFAKTKFPKTFSLNI